MLKIIRPPESAAGDKLPVNDSVNPEQFWKNAWPFAFKKFLYLKIKRKTQAEKRSYNSCSQLNGVPFFTSRFNSFPRSIS
jgi:hypothetical protein